MTNSHLPAQLTEASPEEVLASLARLESSGTVSREQSEQVYTAARRAQIVDSASRALSNAIEWLIVAYLDGEGHHATSVHSIQANRKNVEEAIKDLISESQRAVTTKWRLERAPEHKREDATP